MEALKNALYFKMYIIKLETHIEQKKKKRINAMSSVWLASKIYSNHSNTNHNQTGTK